MSSRYGTERERELNQQENEAHWSRFKNLWGRYQEDQILFGGDGHGDITVDASDLFSVLYHCYFMTTGLYDPDELHHITRPTTNLANAFEAFLIERERGHVSYREAREALDAEVREALDAAFSGARS